MTWGSSHRNSSEEEEINSLHDISSSYGFWKQQRATSQGVLTEKGIKHELNNHRRKSSPWHLQPKLSLLVWNSSKRFWGRYAATQSSQHKALSGLEIHLAGAVQSHNNRVTQSSIPKGFKNSKCSPLKSWGTAADAGTQLRGKPAAPSAGVSQFQDHMSKWHLCWLDYSHKLTLDKLSLDNSASYSFCLLLLFPFLHSPIFIDGWKATPRFNDQVLSVKIHPSLLSQN